MIISVARNAAHKKYGRLAQLVEHLLDVQEVTGSSPVPSTKKTRNESFGSFFVTPSCPGATNRRTGAFLLTAFVPGVALQKK